MNVRFQTFISILVAVVTFTSPATLNILAAELTASRPLVNLAVTHPGFMRPAWGNNPHQQNHRKEVNKTMELDLTQAELPPQGTYPGVFVDVTEGRTLVKKRTHPTLRLHSS